MSPRPLALSLALSLVSVLTLAGPLASRAVADEAPPWEGGVFLGVELNSDKLELGVRDDSASADSPKHGFLFGGRLSYAFGDRLAAEGELAASPTKTRDTGTSLWMVMPRAHALFHIVPDGPLRPFVLAGAGMFISSSDDEAVLENDVDLLFHAGAGVKWDADRTWGLRLDGRLLFPPTTGGDFVTVNGELLLGAYLRFGGDDAAEAAKETREQVQQAVAPPPPKDTDGDGVLDPSDKCVTEAEDKDGFQDEDGCPDPDNDGDGVLDADDQCAGEAENKNGIDDEDGCPDADPDGDGVLGSADGCPEVSEDKDGFQDEDGCPDPDNDGDGVLDADDQCPESLETKNAYRDEDGCEDAVPEVLTKQLGTLQGLEFEANSDKIKSKGLKILDEVAKALAEVPDAKVAIAGYTDDSGDREKNVDLSKRRAAAVKTYLESKGIAAERMTADGFGPDKPVEDNSTAEGRKKNRRVELTLVP